jgi:hypothetical protein
VHRQYGGVSNMTFIIDHTGHIVFRAEWTVADDIRGVLEEVLEMAAIKRAGVRANSTTARPSACTTPGRTTSSWAACKPSKT